MEKSTVASSERPRVAVEWPDARRFAFTIFDDPDAQELNVTRLVYSFLADLGILTTIAVWPVAPHRKANSPGQTCADPAYRDFLLELKDKGFEIAFHNATPHTSTRKETIEALDTFKQYFGADPSSMANHYNGEAIYWGTARVTGWRRTVYDLATRGKNSNRFFGHLEGHQTFWGDICRDRIRYCRNFVFSDINTLAACPWMPYMDPLRPYVARWFSASEGNNVQAFLGTIQDRHQDRLEEDGGACIMYTHFGHRFVQDGKLDLEFRRLMERLARKSVWFVPVTPMLDFLVQQRGLTVLDDQSRQSLEMHWLWEKLFRGTS